MHPSKDKNLSMFFTRNLTEKETDFLSMYFDQDHWGQLFELVQEYENFQLLKMAADEFLLRIGKHEFKVSRDFHRCMITMGNISTLTPGAAELLAKIADLLFYDRKHRFMLQTNNPAFLKMIWERCFELKIPLKPADKAQAELFQKWSAEKGLQNKVALGFAQAASPESPDTPQSPNKPR